MLQNYYKDMLNQKLEWSDLKKVEIATLQNIDYTKLRRYKGFGKTAENKLRELIESFLINLN